MADYDVIVVGAGPGGYVAAIRAAQNGLNTLLIEKRKTLGGTCLNVGCIPSKALLYSSELYTKLSEEGKEHGISFKDLQMKWDPMMKRKEKVVENLVQGVGGLVKKNKVEWIEGTASFKSANELAIQSGKEKKTVSADHIILATGSDSVELPFLPFDEKQVLSSTGALSLKKQPKKMIVIGAGAIGVEMASVYQRLGTEVVVIEMLDRIIPPTDIKISKDFLKILKKQGIQFHLSAKVLEGKTSKKGVSVKFEDSKGEQTIDADVVLVAVGRKPFFDGLELEKAGIKLDERGLIAVDGRFQTNQKGIYAIGDIIEGPMLAHKASEEGIAVADIIAGKHTHINYMCIPNVVYTNPEVATVGLSEEEAKEAGLKLLTGTSYYRGNPRARCIGEEEGIVKVLGDQKTGRLIGLHIVGPQASEMIGEGVIALQNKTSVEQLAHSSHAHPTLSEAIKEAALAAIGQPLHQ